MSKGYFSQQMTQGPWYIVEQVPLPVRLREFYFSPMLGFFKPHMFEIFMRPRKILSLLLLAWAFQSAHSFAAPSSVATSRVAGGDMPLNLLEVDGRWLISTNSGWHNADLQS